MKKVMMISTILIGSLFALDQETECLVLKMNEKEFVILKGYNDPAKAFEKWMERTNRTGRAYRIIFEGSLYKLIFE